MFKSSIASVLALSFLLAPNALASAGRAKKSPSFIEVPKKITRAPKPLPAQDIDELLLGGIEGEEILPVASSTIEEPEPTTSTNPVGDKQPASEKPAVTAEESATDPTEALATEESTQTPAVIQKKSSATPARPTSTQAAPTVVPPDQSLRWLTNGNTRYVSKRLRADGRSPQDRERLVQGQKPHAIVLSCSDSRVPPEHVFDQALGEIFVIRVAGQALDSSVIASIEYAVEHLGPKLLVVMGHTSCGAVGSALSIKEGTTAGSEALDKLLSDIRPRLKTVSTDKLSPGLEVESTLNADGVAREIVRRSEILRKKVDSGDLVIKPALYRLNTGKVTFY